MDAKSRLIKFSAVGRSICILTLWWSHWGGRRVDAERDILKPHLLYSKDEKQLEAENRVHRFNQGLSCCLIFFIFFCKHFSVTPCWMEFLKRATREIRLRLEQNERIALFTIFNWTQERFAFFSPKTGDLRKNPKNCWALLKSDDIESLFQKERRERFAWKPKEILCSFTNIDES